MASEAFRSGVRSASGGREKDKEVPLANDGEVVLDALVVDVRVGLEAGHGHLRRADGLRSGGHAGGQSLD